jgi:hypothetical protein
MLTPTALFLVGLAVFLAVCWLRAVRECHRLRFERDRLRFERDRLAELNARLWWENDGLYRRLAEKTLAVGRLLQTLAGDGTRRN